MRNNLTVSEKKRKALAVWQAYKDGKIEPCKDAIETFAGMRMKTVNRWLYAQVGIRFIPTPAFGREAGLVPTDCVDMDDEAVFSIWHKGMAKGNVDLMNEVISSVMGLYRQGKIEKEIVDQFIADGLTEIYEVQELTAPLHSRLNSAMIEMKHLPAPEEVQ